MRAGWAIAFAAGCACGLAVGVLLPRGGTDLEAVRPLPGTSPAPAPHARAGDAASAPASSADARSAGRARRDEVRGSGASEESVAERIARIQPDDRWSGMSDVRARSLSRDELVAAARTLLARRLSLQKPSGIELRPILERFLRECPDEPLDCDDVLAFVAQDQSGLGWDCMRHIPAERRMAAFVTLFEGGPPWDGSGMEQKGDGAGRLFDLVVEDDPERVLALLGAAMRGAPSRRTDLAYELVQRRPAPFAGLLADVAAHDPDRDRRRNAFFALQRAQDEDPDAAAVFARAVLARSQSDDYQERKETFALLAYAGPPGLELARKTLERGGLDEVEETALVQSLVVGGRALDVVAPGMSETRVCALLDAVDCMGEPSEAHALLAPRVGEVQCPSGREDASRWSRLVCNCGRPELALAIARSPERPAAVRVAVLTCVIEDERTSEAAVGCAGVLLADASSETALRRALVDALVVTRGGESDTAALELLRRVASTDANGTIRAAAAAGVKSMSDSE